MAEHSWNPSTQVTLEDRKENQPELKGELAGPVRRQGQRQCQKYSSFQDVPEELS